MIRRIRHQIRLWMHESPPADRCMATWVEDQRVGERKFFEWRCRLNAQRIRERQIFNCRMKGGYITCKEPS